jgi:hypothetical protein
MRCRQHSKESSFCHDHYSKQPLFRVRQMEQEFVDGVVVQILIDLIVQHGFEALWHRPTVHLCRFGPNRCALAAIGPALGLVIVSTAPNRDCGNRGPWLVLALPFVFAWLPVRIHCPGSNLSTRS